MPLKLVILAVVLAWARPADACVLQGTNPVVFGDYDVYATSNKEMLGGVKYYCILSLSIRVDLSTGSSGSYAMRTMKKGSETLNYQLYVDSAKTQVWGNGNNNGTSTYGPFIGLLVSTTIPIHGVIPKNQNVSTGAYTDTVVVTFNY